MADFTGRTANGIILDAIQRGASIHMRMWSRIEARGGMSTDTKYQVMGELLGIMPSAIEKAEEQASRIIEMVKGDGRFAPVIRCPNGTGVDLDQYLEEPASLKVQVPLSKPKHHPIQTEESKALNDMIASLRNESGMNWKQIASEVGLSVDATRTRYRDWQKKQKQFYVTQKDEPKNDTEQISSQEIYEPGADEARREADLAEATIRKSLTVEEFIQERIAAGDPDYEIWQAVKRNFPGISMNVADIRSRRQVA